MSQSTAVRIPARHARTAPRPVPAPPRLRVVSAPEQSRSRAGSVVACLGLLVAGLVTVLLVQMSLERGAYALERAQSQARVLGEQQQALREEIERLQAPQNLAAQAAKYGMVYAPNPAFLRASDGKVLGVPAPGVAQPSPTVKKPSPAATAKPAATPTGSATASLPGAKTKATQGAKAVPSARATTAPPAKTGTKKTTGATRTAKATGTATN